MNPRDIYYIYDDPIPFKNDLKLYPVSMRDYLWFFLYARCLLLEKNSIAGNPELAIRAISMSYLEYLYYDSQTGQYSAENPSPADLLHMLFRLTFKLPEESKIYMGYGDDGKPIFSIDENVYDSSDFDLFREIVAEQNMLDLPNEAIQKNVRDSIRQAREYKARLEGKEMAGLEDQIIALSLFTGWELDRIYDMTIRKFMRSLQRANHMIYQDKYLGAELGGMVSFKDKSILSGWLAKIKEEDDFSDVTMDADRLQGKIDMSEAKENAMRKSR